MSSFVDFSFVMSLSIMYSCFSASAAFHVFSSCQIFHTKESIRYITLITPLSYYTCWYSWSKQNILFTAIIFKNYVCCAKTLVAQVRLSELPGLLLYHTASLGEVLDLMTLEDEGTMFPLKCWNHTPSDTASQPRRHDLSATLL
jgi:hypothetical protein